MGLIGIHVSDILEIDSRNWKGINLFQFFVSPSTNYHSEKYTKIHKYIKKHDIHLLIHASYSINLSKRWTESDSWVQQFITEIQKSAELGAFGIVIHTGKQLDLSIAEAINNMHTLLLHVHNKTQDCKNIKILIETPAGQGTETLSLITDFCKFMTKFYTHPDHRVGDRFGICVDTCHIFAAGHDIRIQSQMNTFFSTIDQIIGTDKIKVCHMNDSKKDLGSKIDRHMNIGQGMIGKKALERIIIFMKTLEIPIIFETPSEMILKDYLMAK